MTSRLPLPSERKKKRLHGEISQYAQAHAGTDLDLDGTLEDAGLAALQSEEVGSLPETALRLAITRA